MFTDREWRSIFRNQKAKKSSKLQCQSLTQAGKQCKLSALVDSKYCKRHNTVIITPLFSEPEIENKSLLCDRLSPDVELLMFSYLPLEEILILFKNDHQGRDKIIKIYFHEFPKLSEVIQNGHLEILKYLIETKKEEPRSCFIRKVAQLGHFEIFKYLVNLKIVETFPNRDILDIAIIYNRIEIVNFILDLKIKGLKPSKYTLDSVCKHNNLELFKNLVSLGLNPTAQIFHEVYNHQDLQIFKYLLELGIKPNQNVLEFYFGSGNIELLKYIINSGEYIIRNSYLISCVERDLLDIIKLAVSKHANISWKVLESAVLYNKREIIEYLLSIGIKPTGRVIHTARYKGYMDLVMRFEGIK